MSLFKRFVFYFIGFSIGILFLYFFFNNKGASFEFAFFPNARTLKNIRLKKRVFTENSLKILRKHQLDTADISYLLKEGDVLFSESNTQLDSCRIYVIEGNSSFKENSSLKNLKITVENCDKKATIQKIIVSEAK